MCLYPWGASCNFWLTVSGSCRHPLPCACVRRGTLCKPWVGLSMFVGIEAAVPLIYLRGREEKRGGPGKEDRQADERMPPSRPPV